MLKRAGTVRLAVGAVIVGVALGALALLAGAGEAALVACGIATTLLVPILQQTIP